MIVIPKDLSGKYPEAVTELLKHLQVTYDEEDYLVEFYDDSVIVGCDCGCGGESYMDDLWKITEEQADIFQKLREHGYEVEDRDADYDTDVADVEGD